MPYKILFFSGMSTEDSTGELSQIFAFCEKLNKEEFIYRILIKYSRYLQFPLNDIDFYYNNSLDEFKNYLDYFKPDMIILSEYPHTPEIFLNYLLEKNILLVTFDCTGIIRESNNVDTFKVISIKPCPVNNPTKNDKFNKYWDIFRDSNFIKDKDKIIQRYNLDLNTKIVLYSIAPWAYHLSLHYKIESFYGYLLDLLFKIFASFEEKISLFLISPIKIQSFQKNNLSVFTSSKLKNRDYKELLNNVDLIISENIVQASMAKSFMNYTNILAMINTLDIEVDFLPKFNFNIFPLGFIDFNLPENYEYYKLITKSEVFDENDLRNKLKYLLKNKIESQYNYIELCRELLSNNDILREIIKENL
ncbi:MAG: DUF6365 family protein [Candidatus Sericytochromatia bacterium]